MNGELIFSLFEIPLENFLKAKAPILGFWEEDISSPWRDPGGEISLKSPVSLHYLLNEILKIRDTDKVFLVDGKYRTPVYDLQDGD
jgi:hypothetical protein